MMNFNSVFVLKNLIHFFKYLISARHYDRFWGIKEHESCPQISPNLVNMELLGTLSDAEGHRMPRGWHLTWTEAQRQLPRALKFSGEGVAREAHDKWVGENSRPREQCAPKHRHEEA